MMKHTTIVEKLKKTLEICESLLSELSTKTIKEKIAILKAKKNVETFLEKKNTFTNFLRKESTKNQYVIFCLIAIGQEKILFHFEKQSVIDKKYFSKLIKTLYEVENFYNTLGGIIGYHRTVISMLLQKKNTSEKNSIPEKYFAPPVIDIRKLNIDVRKAIRIGIDNIATCGELYAIGGAGDRLQLKNEVTGECLPAALLPFLGRNLLFGLIRDVEAKEFLQHRLFKISHCIPIAFMTSMEKNNRTHIENICRKHNWFGRGENNFRFFNQPQVPIISENGDWLSQNGFELLLKPGGHGVIWKQANDKKILDWFIEKKISRLLVRQINNPMAGIDYGILATVGYGILNKKSYGVLSCDRLVNSSEGTNVLCERKTDQFYKYGITNIEYTEFSEKGIEDVPKEEGSRYSSFPANTNIIIIELEALKYAINKLPIPGLILNLKTSFKHFNDKDDYKEILGGRLESSMQNIADAFFIECPNKIIDKTELELKTFLTYNTRRKTIAVTKNNANQNTIQPETPIGTHYEMLRNYHDLLKNHCKIELSPFASEHEYIQKGPSIIADFHPAIGPLWEIISQKIRKGKFSYGAEFILEIADVNIESLSLSGSLIIEATHITGKRNSNGEIVDSNYTGKCTLKNIKVENCGFLPFHNNTDKSKKNIYWSNKIQRKESMHIILHGNAEFHASNVTFKGNHVIEVFEGTIVVAHEKNGKIHFEKKYIDNSTWNWNYHFDNNNHIQLTL